MKKCDFCGNDVPKNGQCNKCGFIDGFMREPNDDEFRIARKINSENEYKQFKNIDSVLLELIDEYL